MQRYFNVGHAWLHVRCLIRMIREWLLMGRHRGKFWWHVAFYCKGILRSFGITS